MAKLPYFHINAFGDGPFKGNQAAVMPLNEWLDDDILQAIGEENNFAETAFYIPDKSGAADYALRWFTPSLEIALCGHATLASGFHILNQNPDKECITFRTRKAGILSVKREGDDYIVGLPSYRPTPAEMPDWVSSLDSGGSLPLDYLVRTGGYNLFIYENADKVRALNPDFPALIAAGGDAQFICSAPADNAEDYDVISRIFVPGASVNEDSVTGSAHAVLTPYWTERLGRDNFKAHQASLRGGYLNCSIDADMVWLGGKCALIIEGVFSL